jgi:hypothetical protein
MLSRTLLLSFLCSLDSSFPLSRAFNGHSFPVVFGSVNSGLWCCREIIIAFAARGLLPCLRRRLMYPFASFSPHGLCASVTTMFILQGLTCGPCSFLFFPFLKRLILQPDYKKEKMQVVYWMALHWDYKWIFNNNILLIAK